MPNADVARRAPTGLESALLALALTAALTGGVWHFQWHARRMTRSRRRAAAKPVKIAVVKITAPECKDCVQVTDLVDAFKKQPLLEVTDEKRDRV